MLKKIILIAAALLIAYLLVVGVPRWIGKEKAAESQRNDLMEEQANRRANSIVPGAAGGRGRVQQAGGHCGQRSPGERG